MRVGLGSLQSEGSVNHMVQTYQRFAKGVRYAATLFVMPLGPAGIILGQPFYSGLQLQVDYGPARSVTFPKLPNGRKPITLPTLPAAPPRPAAAMLATLSYREMKQELRRQGIAGRSGFTSDRLALIHLRVRSNLEC